MCGSSLLNNLTKWRVWRTVLLGQFLSCLLCATGVTSQLLQGTYNVYMPTAQSFLNYVMLCLIFTTWLACKPGDRGLLYVLRKRGWKYLLLAAVDVEANFLLVKAFQYTTLTSVQLLDCFTIPVVLVLSWLCIKVRYGIVHVLGVCLALVGVGCLVYADIEEGRADIQAKNRFLGDMLCISGAALYGVSNVAEEYVVKSYSIVEFLGMIGLFGSIVNGIQIMFLEKEEVSQINWEKWQEISLILGFSACLLLLYITMPLVLQISSATAVNISILSADFYSLMTGLYLFQFKFHWLYFVSFSCVLLGVTIYNLEQAPSVIDGSSSDDNLPGTGFCEQTGSCNSTDYQGVDPISGAHPSMTPSSTVTTTTYNPYTANNTLYRDSRYDLNSLSNTETLLRQTPHYQGQTILPSPSLESQCVVSVHASQDGERDRAQAQARDDQKKDQGLVRGVEYQKRNGIPKFIWEDSC